MICTRYNSLYTVSEDTDKEEFAREISAVIMDEYEPKLVDRSIELNYSFLERWEIDEIENIAHRLEWEDGNGEYPSFAEREAIVRKKLEEYLAVEKSVNPRGFADFRLKELSAYAEAIASNAADCYFAEKEYEEFVELLSIFISSRPSIEKTVHVLWKDGSVRLYNRFKRDITAKYEADFYEYSQSRGANDEDLAISALIAAAPERVILHLPPSSSPLAKTLKKIFGENCEICKGCSFCKKD